MNSVNISNICFVYLPELKNYLAMLLASVMAYLAVATIVHKRISAAVQHNSLQAVLQS